MADNQGPEITICDLLNDFDAMTTLASFMDNYYDKNCIRLGEYLIINVPDQIPENFQKRLKGLQKFFHGGGSPTLAFLDANAINNPTDTVKNLRDHALEVRRMDLIEVLASLMDNFLLKDLTEEMKDDIANLLDDERTAFNWESFASNCGYTDDGQREGFRNQRTVPGIYTPFKKLIQVLKKANSEFPISHIINWALSADRNDIGNSLKKFTQKKKEAWQREHNQNESNVASNQPVTNDLDSSRAEFALTPDNQTDDLNQPAGPTEFDDTSDGGPSNQMERLHLDENDEPDLT